MLRADPHPGGRSSQDCGELSLGGCNGVGCDCVSIPIRGWQFHCGHMGRTFIAAVIVCKVVAFVNTLGIGMPTCTSSDFFYVH